MTESAGPALDANAMIWRVPEARSRRIALLVLLYGHGGVAHDLIVLAVAEGTHLVVLQCDQGDMTTLGPASSTEDPKPSAAARCNDGAAAAWS